MQHIEAPALAVPTAEVAKELELLEWIVNEAVEAHQSAKAIALKNQKPIPLAALRVAVQAQNRRMGLLGIAPLKARILKANATEMAEWAEKTLENLAQAYPENSAAPLSRQQRRAMEREQAKQLKRKAA